MTPSFYTKIEDGKILDSTFNDYLKRFNGFYEISVRKPKRSTKQNSFYWKYLTIIEEETGNNAMDLHEIAKRMFLKPIFKTVMGKEYKLPASTTKLSKTEFSDYMDKICDWSGVPIPETNY